MPSPVLTASGICKSYGAPVLRQVALEVHSGEVHALIGENGAGKSTLARIIAGVTLADSGSMHLAGRPFSPRRRGDASHAGIGFVMQELNLIGPMTVAESLFLDALPNRLGVIDRQRLEAMAQNALDRVGLADLDPQRPVGSLGVAQQQLVEIGAALAKRCSVLLLDEPTAALTPTEVESLFAQIERLRREGVAIVFISHRLAEVTRLADRVSVLRDGRLVAHHSETPVDRDVLVREMVGRDVAGLPERQSVESTDTALRIEGFTGRRFDRIDLAVGHGEILGLAGLMGAGRTELLRAIFGADRPSSGQLWMGSEERPTQLRSPRDAVRHGMALLPEDRKSDGLLLPFSVCANTTLANLRAAAGPLGWVRSRQEHRLARVAVEGLELQARSAEQPVSELSGGNQQKVLIGRWLLCDPDVFLVDEPTRGIDVGARAQVHRLLLDLASQGKAIVVASSEHEELLAICDRILVLSAGHMSAELRRSDEKQWTSRAILRAAIGGPDGEVAA